MDDLRLVQLARLLGLPRETLDADQARERTATDPAALGRALFAEAAENDDVTGPEAALDYLEARLRFFGDLIPDPGAIRRTFAAELRAWE